ncbi:MAG: ECF transporter S component [Oscillospiraceae bacterium]|jgi:riboflavin transporter FmnP|nr:ECF transporter S component [Oscillospiraceae bacterium]
MKKNDRFSVRYLAMIGMFAALAFVLTWATRPIPKVAGILSYDPKDAVVVIAGFLLGPLASLIISVLSSFIEFLSISDTGLIGFLMNVVSTCSFAVPAAFFYQKHRSMKGAVLSLAIGVTSMAACMVAWNYIVTPIYMEVERAQVAAMLGKVFLPFNLVKGGLNAGLALLLYKPLTAALRKARLALPSPSEHKGRFHLGFTLFALAVFVTFTLLLLVMLKVI